MESANTFDYLCGFYELSIEGIVFYARLKQHGKLQKADQSLVGNNFFKEVFRGENAAELFRHFRSFVSGRLTTDSFIFGGKMHGQFTPLRVMLVRIAEKKGDVPNSELLFLLDLQPA